MFQCPREHSRNSLLTMMGGGLCMLFPDKCQGRGLCHPVGGMGNVGPEIKAQSKTKSSQATGKQDVGQDGGQGINRSCHFHLALQITSLETKSHSTPHLPRGSSSGALPNMRKFVEVGGLWIWREGFTRSLRQATVAPPTPGRIPSGQISGVRSKLTSL
jgi:hypothetical protein